MAKPQLRGQEGQKITLNLGDEIPVANTTFGSIGGAGSLATTPVSSYTYKDVGINVIVTPRVTFDGDVILELTRREQRGRPGREHRRPELPVVRIAKGRDARFACATASPRCSPACCARTRAATYKGFPGLIHLPVFKSLFTSNDLSSGQTDIVMLLTPRIVRGHDLKQQDINPVYIGSQQNLGLTGPPPLIGAPEPGGAAPAPPAPQGAPGQLAARSGRNRHAAAARRRPADAAGAGPSTTPPPLPPQPEAAAAADAAAGAVAHASGARDHAGPGAAAVVRMMVTTPGPEFRLGGGPYTVPISVSDSPRVTTVTVTLTFNPAVLKVRSVQEGSFMRQGGVDGAVHPPGGSGRRPRGPHGGAQRRRRWAPRDRA